MTNAIEKKCKALEWYEMYSKQNAVCVYSAPAPWFNYGMKITENNHVRGKEYSLKMCTFENVVQV